MKLSDNMLTLRKQYVTETEKKYGVCCVDCGKSVVDVEYYFIRPISPDCGEIICMDCGLKEGKVK